VAALIMVLPGKDWQSSGGLIDWTLEYLIPRMSDKETAAELRTVVDENLGSLWIPDLPAATQEEIYQLLRSGLVDAGRRELPDGPAKADALDQLQELVDLTQDDSPSAAK
jgi:hypothetical protein